jgi:hypothetical protein
MLDSRGRAGLRHPARTHAGACAGARESLNCRMITKTSGGGRLILTSPKAPPSRYVLRHGRPFLIPFDPTGVGFGYTSFFYGPTHLPVATRTYFYPLTGSATTQTVQFFTLQNDHSSPTFQPTGGIAFNSYFRATLFFVIDS